MINDYNSKLKEYFPDHESFAEENSTFADYNKNFENSCLPPSTFDDIKPHKRISYKQNLKKNPCKIKFIPQILPHSNANPKSFVENHFRRSPETDFIHENRARKKHLLSEKFKILTAKEKILDTEINELDIEFENLSMNKTKNYAENSDDSSDAFSHLAESESDLPLSCSASNLKYQEYFTNKKSISKIQTKNIKK